MHAKVITTAIFKGGTGKTTTALNVGTELIRRGYKVLFIDLDPQQNLSNSLAAPAGHTGTLEVLTRGKTIAECRTNYKTFSLLQASIDLMEVTDNSKATAALKKALEGVRSEYDFIIMDTAPFTNALSIAAINATDLVIIPAQPTFYCYTGLVQFLTAVPASKVLGVLVTMQRGTNITQQYTEAIANLAKKNGVKTFTTQIRLCTKVQEAQDLRMALGDYAPGCTAQQDYSMITDEIIERAKHGKN